jgi:N-acylneuraminate cytidylyltransferase
VSQLIEEGADSLFSAARTNGFAWRRDDEGVRSMSYDYRDRPRRQEIGDDFIENGSIYVFKPRVLRDMGNRLGGKIEIYEMDPLNSFQIDEQGDIDLMEQILCIASVSRPVPDLSSTRLLVLDFDGVMTDDRVTVRQDGLESVVCHRGDGFGIEQLSRIGIDTVVLSKETNPVVEARCAKLGVQCHKGFDDKLPKLEALAAERDLEPEGVVFVGNDVNDLECVRWAGTGVAVRGARPELLAAADWVTKRRGGEGAVREVCDAIMKQQSKGNA